MRAVLVLCALLGAASALPELPSVDLTGNDINDIVDDFPSQSKGGWWLRVGNQLFSPALAGDGDHVDRNIDHFKVVAAASLPAPLSQLRVGGDAVKGIHILNIKGAEHSKPVATHLQHLNAESVAHGMKFLVDARQSQNLLDLEIRHKHLNTAKSNKKAHSKAHGAANFETEDVHEAVQSITQASYEHELSLLTGEGSGPQHQRNVHAMEGHATAERYLSCRMKEAGMAVQLVTFAAGNEQGMNVVGCRPGQTKDFLLVGAHYDTLPQPPSTSPGAMDNGSGVAVVMSTLEAVKGYNFKNTLCTAGFDGEEMGLLGSREIARQIAKDSNLKSHFIGAITSDMATGYKPKFGTSRDAGWSAENSNILRSDASDPRKDGIHIDGNSDSSELIDRFEKAAMAVVEDDKMPILSSTHSLWNSDHKAFLGEHLKAIDICSANHRSYEYWHNLHNTTDCLDFAIGKEIARTTAAAVMSLAEEVGKRDLEEEPADVDDSLLPHFTGSEDFKVMTMEEAFQDPPLDCAKVLSHMKSTASSTDHATSHVTAKSALKSHGHHKAVDTPQSKRSLEEPTNTHARKHVADTHKKGVAETHKKVVDAHKKAGAESHKKVAEASKKATPDTHKKAVADTHKKAVAAKKQPAKAAASPAKHSKLEEQSSHEKLDKKSLDLLAQLEDALQTVDTKLKAGKF